MTAGNYMSKPSIARRLSGRIKAGFLTVSSVLSPDT